MVTEQQCPRCDAVVPYDIAYPMWCDRCDWNVQAEADEPAAGLFDRMYAHLGQRSGQALFDEIVQGKRTATAMVTLLLARLCALVVHAVTLLFVLLGLLLVVQGNIITIVLGLLCWGIAWLVRPRLGRMPSVVLSSNEFPTLHKIADGVSTALGAVDVDVIAVDTHFNASFSRVGLGGSSVLTLGVPLLWILDPQETVALMAHEVAHDVNGDPRCGFLIGSAVRSLMAWYELLQPSPVSHRRRSSYRRGSAELVEMVAEVLGFFLTGTAGTLAWILTHLLYRDSQRAEFYAGALAADIAGSTAMLSLLDKLHLHRMCEGAVLRVANEGGTRSILGELERRVAAMPAREMERLKRVDKLQGTRLDATHPPTIQRATYIAGRPKPIRLSLDPWVAEELRAELARLEPSVQQVLLEKHHRGLYY